MAGCMHDTTTRDDGPTLTALEREFLAEIKTALPYVERVADTTPTEMNRQRRQRQACKDVATMRATIAKAEARRG